MVRLPGNAEPEAELIVDCRNVLGEGVLWSERDRSLYWLDIEAAELWRYDPASGETVRRTLAERAGSFAFRAGGGLIVAFASGFAFYDPDSGERTRIAEIEPDLPTRLNDGRCDRAGRFLAGTMDESPEKRPIAGVYRLDADLTVERLIGGITTANSLSFSPDGRTLYFADTPKRVIHAYDYDPETGRISRRRVFRSLDDQPGKPDGSTVDAEGCLWNAQWQGGRIVRYRPDGAIDRVVAVPAPNVTCVALGGPDLDILYVTTARQGMSAADLEVFPQAGGLFALCVDVPGLPEATFGG